MSAGSGFHSITGDWQFDDFSIDGVNKPQRGPSRGQLNRKDSAKSRKIAIDGDAFYLMGFVKLTILSEELKAQRESEREAKIEAERKIKAEELAKEKAEQVRIEAEKRAKEEAIRRDEEERIANEKAEQEEKERLQKEREDKLKQAQEANAAKKEELKSTGLLTLANIDEFTKGKNIIKDYKKLKKSIDSSQFEYIKDFIKRCINKDNKKWKSVKRENWKDVKSWVGQETAQQWYNELSNK
ncbi:MAG: cell envelope integrity protein TolA [Draconibacterium sp.]|nr:cell envelope integrity protein TolA [Draconibacterium sp.]